MTATEKIELIKALSIIINHSKDRLGDSTEFAVKLEQSVLKITDSLISDKGE